MELQNIAPAELKNLMEKEQARKEVINRTNRILSGSAYRRGMYSGLDLLRRLRSDPYKAKSPEANLDLEQIATHASQAVICTLLFSVLALAVSLFQLIIWWLALPSSDYDYQRYSYEASDVNGNSFLLTLVPVLSFISAALISYEWFYLRWANTRRFLKQSYEPGFRLEYLQSLTNYFKERILSPEPSQNVITFGGYLPFLGSGEKISGWTLVVERAPKQSDDGARREEIIAIREPEFYKAVDETIAGVTMSDIQTSSALFVNGDELEADGVILAQPESRPVANIGEEQIWRIGQGALSADKRAYRLYRYVDVARDMMLSYYLRFHNVGSVTFIEATAYILNGIDRERYSLISALKDNKLIRLIKTGVLALVLFFFSLIISIAAFIAAFNVLMFLLNLISWKSLDARQRRSARSQEEYNYGLPRTFRESVAASVFRDYYGVQDMTMYWKAIEDAVLKGVVALLKERGVDTSKFEQNVTTIVNSGIMVSGGQFTATQVAAGSGAAAVMGAQTAKGAHNPLQGMIQNVTSRLNPGAK